MNLEGHSSGVAWFMGFSKTALPKKELFISLHNCNFSNSQKKWPYPKITVSKGVSTLTGMSQERSQWAFSSQSMSGLLLQE